MRKTTRLLMVALLCVLLAGTMASAKTVITYWTHTHPPMVDLNHKLIEEFEKLNPDIEIEYTVIPNNDFFTKALTAMSTGTGPDVINMSSGNSQISVYMESDIVAPVMPEAFGFASQAELEDAWLSGAFDGVYKDGAIYGIPSEYNTTALVINARHFREAGLDPNNPPKTWKEVLEYGEKLTIRQGNQIQRRGFDFLYAPNFFWIDFGNLLGQLGGSYLNPDHTESTVNDEAAVKALQFWYDMVHEQEIAGPYLSMMDSTNIMTDFIMETVSMSLVFPWSVELLQGTPIWEDSVIVPLPQMDPANPVNLAWAYYWMVNKDAKDIEASWKFVNFLASHPEQWLTNVGFIHPRKGWADSAEARDFPFIDVWLAEMNNSWFGDRTIHLSEILSSLRMAIERSIMDGVDPQTSLDQAKQEIDRLMN